MSNGFLVSAQFDPVVNAEVNSYYHMLPITVSLMFSFSILFLSCLFRRCLSMPDVFYVSVLSLNRFSLYILFFSSYLNNYNCMYLAYINGKQFVSFVYCLKKIIFYCYSSYLLSHNLILLILIRITVLNTYFLLFCLIFLMFLLNTYQFVRSKIEIRYPLLYLIKVMVLMIMFHSIKIQSVAVVCSGFSIILCSHND